MPDGTDPSPAHPSLPDLHVMTFNLRFAADSPPDSWAQRRPVMRALLRRDLPDLLGTQEGRPQQLLDLAADLPARYDSVGTGRDGDGRGEAMQVFYNVERLDARESGHFWLSDTPGVAGSKTWDGCCARMVTWVRFLDRASGTQFYALNTHLEAFSQDARTRSADLVLAHLAGLDPTLPVLLTGDFNEAAAAGEAVYDRLVTHGPLVDTWEAARTRGPLFATFHGFRPHVPNGARIDWILSSPEVRTRTSTINTFSRDWQLPSDHFPVQAWVALPVA